MHAMKVVRTQVSATESAVLETYGRSHDKTIKEAVREAIRRLTLNDSVDADDRIFKMSPLTRKKAKHSDASERHDFCLYGWDK